MFANFTPNINLALTLIFMSGGCALYMAWKFLNGNPDVKDAAKKAAAGKAIDLIGKLFKK